MIKHIVLFKLVEFESAEAKQEKLNEIKSGLEALPKLIAELKLLTVGINVNPAEKFDIALTTEFSTMEDLAIYAKHPDHVKIGAVIRAVLADRACVDYNF